MGRQELRVVFGEHKVLRTPPGTCWVLRDCFGTITVAAAAMLEVTLRHPS